jgi:hypothetical protein
MLAVNAFLSALPSREYMCFAVCPTFRIFGCKIVLLKMDPTDLPGSWNCGTNLGRNSEFSGGIIVHRIICGRS